jgi:hypothetical protein
MAPQLFSRFLAGIMPLNANGHSTHSKPKPVRTLQTVAGECWLQLISSPFGGQPGRVLPIRNANYEFGTNLRNGIEFMKSSSQTGIGAVKPCRDFTYQSTGQAQ